jgi:hypothetical protein
MLCLGVVGDISNQLVLQNRKEGIIFKISVHILLKASQSSHKKMMQNQGETIMNSLLLLIKQQQ